MIVIISEKPSVTREFLKATCFFWIVAKLIGWRMFTAYRLFPTAPVFEWMNSVPSIIHGLLFFVSISIMLYVILISTIHEGFLIALVAVEILSCLLDQNRWQPWEYQYLFTIIVLILNLRSTAAVLTVWIFILAFIYVYSGLSKFSLNFVRSTWTETILGGFFRLSRQTIGNGLLFYMGFLPGITEFVLGLSLFFSKTRKTAATMLIAMHVFILIVFGPLGINYNVIIWPWNMAMIFFLFILFIKPNTYKPNFSLLFGGSNKLVIIAWGLLPAFSFFGYWDYYLSSSLYSDLPPKMEISFSNKNSCQRIYEFCHGKPSSEFQNNILTWSYAETNVPVYPELRVYKTLQHKLELQYPKAGLLFEYHQQNRRTP